MSRSQHTHTERRIVVVCLDSPGPRHDETASASRGSYAARLSESSLIRFARDRRCQYLHDSPAASEPGSDLSGHASTECRCTRECASRASRSAPSSVRRREALGNSRGAAARADQGCVVRNTAGISRVTALHGDERLNYVITTCVDEYYAAEPKDEVSEREVSS
jgi:hypothetical protein